MPHTSSTSPTLEPLSASLTRRILRRFRSQRAGFALCGLLMAAPFAAGCAQEVEPELTVRDIDPETVRMMVEALGKMSPAEIEKRKAKGDIDGVARLPPDACDGPCHFALLDVYIENKGAAPIAPPVLRLDAPEGRPARRAVSFRGHEISPRREGRIRWLVALYPEERQLSAHLSSSIFFDLNATNAEDPSEKPAATEESAGTPRPPTAETKSAAAEK